MRINLGCGYKKRDGFINGDVRKDVGADLICDFSAGLPFPDDSVDEVMAFDFLEHVPQLKAVGVIEEIYRVLKPGGKFEHFTPSTDGRGAFQDPTHLSYWCYNTWQYFR